MTDTPQLIRTNDPKLMVMLAGATYRIEATQIKSLANTCTKNIYVRLVEGGILEVSV